MIFPLFPRPFLLPDASQLWISKTGGRFGGSIDKRTVRHEANWDTGEGLFNLIIKDLGVTGNSVSRFSQVPTFLPRAFVMGMVKVLAELEVALEPVR